MNSGKDLVSVIIPCYNYAQFLGEAIESVLEQTHRNFEIIVVDDGSTDNTAEVASRYSQVRLSRQKNMGVSAARNNGLRESSGEYIVFLDADDCLLSHALETGLKCLNDHPECAFVCGHCQLIASDESLMFKLENPAGIQYDLILTLLSWKHFIIPGSVMFRRSIFDKVSWFNPSFQGTEDFELYFRIAWKFPVYWHDEVVLQYRRHNKSITSDYENIFREILKVLHMQEKHVIGSRILEEAYKSGIRDCTTFYGEELCKKLRTHLERRERKQAVQIILVLLRYYPWGFMKRFLPKTSYITFRLTSAMKSLKFRCKSSSRLYPEPQYEGYLDRVDCQLISGWAWNANDPESPVVIDIYSDTLASKKVPASEFRVDLLEAGKGNGYHAFYYHTPRILRDGKSHSVSARIMGTEYNLIGGPKQLCCKSSVFGRES